MTADALGMILFWRLAFALVSGSMVLGLYRRPGFGIVAFETGRTELDSLPAGDQFDARGDRSSGLRKNGAPPDLFDQRGSKRGITRRSVQGAVSWSHIRPSVLSQPAKTLPLAWSGA